MRHRRALAYAGVAALAIIIGLGTDGALAPSVGGIDAGTSRAAAPPGSSTGSVSALAEAARQSTRHPVRSAAGSGIPDFAPSLAGVEIDGGIRFDDDGALVLDRDLRRLFDFLLTTLGESDLTAIRQQLAALALTSADATQAQTVLDAFERYLAYLRAAEGAQGPDLQQRLDELIALRRSWLGTAMAEGFFGAEERYAQATLARSAVLADPAIDEAERTARLAAIDGALDPQIVAHREQTTAHLDTMAETRVFEELSVDPATRHEWRRERYGEVAADRLAGLDGQRAAWNQRVDHYFDARAAIESDPALSAAARDEALAELDHSYTEAELRRIAALGRMRARDG